MQDKSFLRSRVLALSSIWPHTLTLLGSVQCMDQNFGLHEDFVMK